VPDDWPALETRTEEFGLAVPLAIIGAGAAGLVAALAASEAGLEPIVFERDALPSGSTALSAGLIPAAGTRWQRHAGLSDDPTRFAQDIERKAKGRADLVLVRRVTETIGPRLEWLADRFGFEFSLVEHFRYPGHTADRMHGLPSRSGRELVDRLREAAEHRGIPIVTEARVQTLLVDAYQQIVGLCWVRPDGQTESAGCGCIILACNGYGGNQAMVAEHIPSLAAALYFGHPGNQGDALRWGAALGAVMRDLSGHQGHGSVAHPHGILITWATISEGGVQVNLDGSRFSNESEGYSEQAARVASQRGGLAFTLFDERIAEIARQFEDFRLAEQQGAILRGADWLEIARRAGLPEQLLPETMAGIEALKRNGQTDAFGRNFAGVSQLKPPFCAVKVEGALFHTQGGLVVDNEARVLKPDGTPILGLFAAGGAVCGVSGPEASGYLSGNGLLTAIALGGIAGEAAARLVRGGDAPRHRG
jgi:fumarate reductase flavoprotein subunit